MVGIVHLQLPCTGRRSKRQIWANITFILGLHCGRNGKPIPALTHQCALSHEMSFAEPDFLAPQVWSLTQVFTTRLQKARASRLLRIGH